ncbi:uncharacterized protein LOC131677618 [Topomyia yanbarensis]|uniref:uncharacterized protein LOC131677618 n=1 Tax=Topomyia yanbarensis TaxID=2498891 RepID=UPI00273BA4CF|nr:uncharacterized protein LOC131677618 [Topomyia yanbarensis]
MTVNEKTRLLPKEYQKSHVIPIPQEDLNNNTTTSLISEFDSYALTKDELAKYIDDPFWNRVRHICFSLYWLLCLVALVISCYIAVSALGSEFCDDTTNGSSHTDNLTNAPSAIISGTTPIEIVSSAGSPGVIVPLLSQPS